MNRSGVPDRWLDHAHFPKRETFRGCFGVRYPKIIPDQSAAVEPHSLQGKALTGLLQVSQTPSTVDAAGRAVCAWLRSIVLSPPANISTPVPRTAAYAVKQYGA
jgi:hypothetical protein